MITMRFSLLCSSALLSTLLCGCMVAIPESGFGQPLDNAASRETPLHFGLFVTPDPNHNPIHPPERFEGFHDALDFEIFPSEADKDVPVYAICDGNVLVSEFA